MQLQKSGASLVKNITITLRLNINDCCSFLKHNQRHYPDSGSKISSFDLFPLKTVQDICLNLQGAKAYMICEWSVVCDWVTTDNGPIRVLFRRDLSTTLINYTVSMV